MAKNRVLGRFTNVAQSLFESREWPWERGWDSPGNEVLASKRIMGRQNKNVNMAERWSCFSVFIKWISFDDLQCCGSASLSPTARIHSGYKFGRKSTGSSVSTDWTNMYVAFWATSLRLNVVDGGISFVRIAGDQVLLLIINFGDIHNAQRSFVVLPCDIKTAHIGGTLKYFPYRDVPPISVSFPGSSVLNRVYNYTCLCLETGPSPQISFPPHFSHIIFADFVCLHRNAWKHKLMYRFYCFEYDNAWSSTEQGKTLQHFLLERVAKFTSLCLEQSQGFVESADSHPSPPPKFLLSTPLPCGLVGDSITTQ